MYAVVGCTECGNYWLLSDPDAAKTATCPRCRHRHQTRKLRRFFESEDRDAAREARAAILADKRGESAAFDELPSVSELERDVERAGVSDDEYLSGSGLNADEVAAAGDAATASARSRSRDEIVRDAFRKADATTADDVTGYAAEHGVPTEAARDLLERLVRRGEVSESRGRYRLL